MAGRGQTNGRKKGAAAAPAEDTDQEHDIDAIGGGPAPSPRELIVVANRSAGLRATADGPASLNGLDVSDLAAALESGGASLVPLFGVGEDRLVAEAAAQMAQSPTIGDGTSAAGESTDVVAPPDLSVFYTVEAPEADLDALCNELSGAECVEAVFVKPGAAPPIAAPPLDQGPPATLTALPATGNFQARQAYLGPSPSGVNALWSHTRTGGKGTDVQIIDVEGAWQMSHEDLAQRRGGIISGAPSSDIRWRNHGTAVIGVYGGDANGRGVVGIVPDAFNEMSSIFGSTGGSARAIRDAAGRLRPGDIILLELHRPGPRHDFQSRDDQKGYIAIEWWPDDYAAIRYATSKGVIVVEAAGNGAENLDDAIYDTNPDFGSSWRNPFNPANPSSSAVVVGAGAPPPGTHGRDHGPDRSRLSFSNHGRRVDAQGWGREVTTTGYGDLQGGTDETFWYTDTFSGTSSASPIVVGALAAIQGVLKAGGQSPLTPSTAIAVLRTTGSPQQAGPGRPTSQRIGNRPDIRAAVEALAPAVRSGIATRYWLLLVPIAPDNRRRLWLFVEGAWRVVNNPTPIQQDLVQRAFIDGTGEVRVWFEGQTVVGLVVTGD